MCQGSPVIDQESVRILVITSGEQNQLHFPAKVCKFCLGMAWWESIFPNTRLTCPASITKFVFRTGTCSSSTVFNAASPWSGDPQAPWLSNSGLEDQEEQQISRCASGKFSSWRKAGEGKRRVSVLCI